jgi:hypothetical protein
MMNHNPPGVVNRMRRYFRLPSPKRALLTRAFLAAAAIQLGLHIFSFVRLRRMVERHRTGRRGYAEQEIAWAAATAARYIPGAACLTQALTAQYLFSKEGYQTKLEIGVRRVEREIQAHAWVERDGEVIAGSRDEDLSYTVLQSDSSHAGKDNDQETIVSRRWC